MFDHISIGVRDVARPRRFTTRRWRRSATRYLSDGDASLGYGAEAVALSRSARQTTRSPTIRSPACISASSRRRERASTRSIAEAMAAGANATMARRGCGRITGPIITPPSSSTRTAIG